VRAYSGAVLGGNSMKISRIVDLHADAGWRVFSFLKIETPIRTLDDIVAFC
jgi:hypothetical protein